MIVRLSRLAATSVSKATAVDPPTKTEGSIARTASLIVGMISRASTESGFNPNVAFKMTLPSITLTAVSGAPGMFGERRMGSTDATPLIFNNRAETASTDDSLTNTSVG